MNWYNYDTNKVFEEKEFKELLKGIIYVLISHSTYDFSAVCKTFNKNITSMETAVLFQSYLERYSAENKVLNEENLEKLLEDVNVTIGDKVISDKVGDIITARRIILQFSIFLFTRSS